MLYEADPEDSDQYVEVTESLGEPESISVWDVVLEDRGGEAELGWESDEYFRLVEVLLKIPF